MARKMAVWPRVVGISVQLGHMTSRENEPMYSGDEYYAARLSRARRVPLVPPSLRARGGRMAFAASCYWNRSLETPGHAGGGRGVRSPIVAFLQQEQRWNLMQLFLQLSPSSIVSLVLLSARRAGIFLRGAVILECAKAASYAAFQIRSQANRR